MGIVVQSRQTMPLTPQAFVALPIWHEVPLLHPVQHAPPAH